MLSVAFKELVNVCISSRLVRISCMSELDCTVLFVLSRKSRAHFRTRDGSCRIVHGELFTAHTLNVSAPMHTLLHCDSNLYAKTARDLQLLECESEANARCAGRVLAWYRFARSEGLKLSQNLY